MAILWRQCGHFLDTMWPLSGDNVAIFWRQCGHFLETMWPLSTNQPMARCDPNILGLSVDKITHLNATFGKGKKSKGHKFVSIFDAMQEDLNIFL